MAILKVQKRTNPYVMIDKRCLDDKRLSWKAKGVLAYLLSKPDDWTVNVRQLAGESKDGRDAVYTALKELREFGYLSTKTAKDDDGKFSAQEYVVHEIPSNQANLPLTENPIDLSENPYTEKPYTENPTHNNNKYIINNNLTKSARTREEEKSPQLKLYTEVFPTNPEPQPFFHDLLNSCDDLDALRNAMLFWQAMNYNSMNVRGIVDTYRREVKEKDEGAGDEFSNMGVAEESWVTWTGDINDVPARWQAKALRYREKMKGMSYLFDATPLHTTTVAA